MMMSYVSMARLPKPLPDLRMQEQHSAAAQLSTFYAVRDTNSRSFWIKVTVRAAIPSQPGCIIAALWLSDAQVREALGPLDPYFTQLADAMVAWVEAWQQLNSAAGQIAAPAPALVGPKAAAKAAAPCDNGDCKANGHG